MARFSLGGRNALWQAGRSARREVDLRHDPVLLEPIVLLPCPSAVGGPREDAASLGLDVTDFMELLETNGAHFSWSLDLCDQLERRFGECWTLERGGYLYRELCRLATGLVDRRAVPVDPQNTSGDSSGLEACSPHYDEDLMAQWKALLFHSATDNLERYGDVELPVVVSGRRATSLSKRRVRLKLQSGARQAEVDVYSVRLGEEVPPTWRPPLDLAALKARLESGQPTFNYEKSGHQAGPRLKAALEQACLASGVVQKGATFYYNPKCSETCRLVSRPYGEETEVILSDGQETVKARVYTVDRGHLERVAMEARLRDCFGDACAKQGLAWRD